MIITTVCLLAMYLSFFMCLSLTNAIASVTCQLLIGTYYRPIKIPHTNSIIKCITFNKTVNQKCKSPRTVIECKCIRYRLYSSSYSGFFTRSMPSFGKVKRGALTGPLVWINGSYYSPWYPPQHSSDDIF